MSISSPTANRSKIIMLLLTLAFTFFTVNSANYLSAVKSVTKLVVKENFSNNRNNWQLIKDSNFYVGFAKGALHIEKLERNRINNGCMWYSKNFEEFDASRNFLISFDARFISYDDVFNGFDFQWGSRDSILYHLAVNTDGWCILERFNNQVHPRNRWTRIDETFNTGLIRLNDNNRVDIIYLNGECTIMINKKQVLQAKIKCSGKQIGFQGCLKVAWEFDNLRIRSSR